MSKSLFLADVLSYAFGAAECGTNAGLVCELTVPGRPAASVGEISTSNRYLPELWLWLGIGGPSRPCVPQVLADLPGLVSACLTSPVHRIVFVDSVLDVTGLSSLFIESTVFLWPVTVVISGLLQTESSILIHSGVVAIFSSCLFSST